MYNSPLRHGRHGCVYVEPDSHATRTRLIWKCSIEKVIKKQTLQFSGVFLSVGKISLDDCLFLKMTISVLTQRILN